MTVGEVSCNARLAGEPGGAGGAAHPQRQGSRQSKRILRGGQCGKDPISFSQGNAQVREDSYSTERQGKGETLHSFYCGF